eukprot:SM000045S16282  [mRNA]  locus=s45:661511:663662:- [translate_table: standard]
MSVLTCNACNDAFADEAAQRSHYRSDWHRYNLKRKVAGLPGVTEDWFTRRWEALAPAKGADNIRFLYKCAVCNKEYASPKAHANHLLSKAHLSAAGDIAERVHQAPIVRPAPARTPSNNGQGQVHLDGRAPPVAGRSSDEEDDWEEVDGDDEEGGEVVSMLGEDGAEAHTVEDLEGSWDPSACLFCDRVYASDVGACVEHMHRAHGFFIPDVEYLSDLQGLLKYLGLKVSKGYMCLFCDERGKQYASVEAVRKHMNDKSHCKLRYGDGEGIAEEELEEFYDFSSSQDDSIGPGMELATGDDDAPVSLSASGMELVIKRADADRGTVSKVAGSRDLARYYRQRPRPSENRDSVLINSVIARYRTLGLTTKQAPWKLKGVRGGDTVKSQLRRADRVRLLVGMRSNVIRNLPNNVPY